MGFPSRHKQFVVGYEVHFHPGDANLTGEARNFIQALFGLSYLPVVAPDMIQLEKIPLLTE